MGIFEIGQEHNKIRLENKKGGSNFVRNHSSRYHDVVGWNPRWRSFTNWRGIPKNKKDTREEHKRNTQEQVQSHIH